MDDSDVAITVIVIGSAMIVGGLCVVLVMLVRTLRALRATVDELQRETLSTVRELHDGARLAAADLDNLDTLLSTADTASRLAYRTVTNPVVKTVAAGAGAKKAIWRLRHPRGTPPGNGRS